VSSGKMGTIPPDKGIGKFVVSNGRGISVESFREDGYNSKGVPSLGKEVLREFARKDPQVGSVLAPP